MSSLVMNRINIGAMHYLSPLDWDAQPRWPVGNDGIIEATRIIQTNQ